MKNKGHILLRTIPTKLYQTGKYMWGLGVGRNWGILGLELSGICGGRVWGETGGFLGLSCQVYVAAWVWGETGGLLDLSCRVYVGVWVWGETGELSDLDVGYGWGWGGASEERWRRKTRRNLTTPT